MILLFHIARGGRFFNEGYTYFEGFENLYEVPIIRDGDYYCMNEDGKIFRPYEDEDGNNSLNEFLFGKEQNDLSGNEDILVSYNEHNTWLTLYELKKGEGRIDVDGDYDSWYTRNTDTQELTDEERAAIMKTFYFYSVTEKEVDFLDTCIAVDDYWIEEIAKKLNNPYIYFDKYAKAKALTWLKTNHIEYDEEIWE